MINKELYKTKCQNCIYLDLRDKDCRYGASMSNKSCKHFIDIFECGKHQCNGCGKCKNYKN